MKIRTESKKNRILFVVTLPPPAHGSAVMSQYVKDSKIINETFDCDYVNLSTSRSMVEIGKKKPIKIIRFLISIFKELWLLMTHHYALCYLTITCHGVGFLKDAPFVLLCHLFGRKILIHQHNKGMANDADRWPYWWLLPLVYKKTKVVLLSWRLYPDIEKYVPRKNVVICPNGIPAVDYVYCERENDIPKILFLSNLIESKGVYVLLDALAQLKENGRRFLCDFVGDETKEIDAKSFRKEITKRELNDFVIFHGPKFGKEKCRFFEEADIFVFPTYYQNETFGLVNLEAMAYGLPIVTTDEGGIPDVVVDSENGMVCKKKDSDSLANCIRVLLEDKGLRIRMGQDGMRKFQEKYTMLAFENRIGKILSSI